MTINGYTTQNEAGFYYIQNENQLFFGPNGVYAPTFTLKPEDKDKYTYPYNGVYWFDTLADACRQFSLDPSQYQDPVLEDRPIPDPYINQFLTP